MVVLIPYEIETLEQERPWANWLIVAACTVTSLIAIFGGGLYEGDFDAWILDGYSLPGLFAHVFMHANILHLMGNMIFLWVFGNAICTNISNLRYLAVFVACTFLSAVVHNTVDGNLAVGASGAINGIVGMVLALYPLNRVHMLWVFMFRGGSCSCRAWMIIMAWFAFDIWGVAKGGGMVAYWAHLGGLAGGLAIGLVGLHFGWFQLTCYDNRSLLEILRGEEPAR